MSSPLPNSEKPDRSVSFFATCVVIGLSYLAIRASGSIDVLEIINNGMLKGGTEPATTHFVIQNKDSLFRLSCCIPLISIGSQFFAQAKISLYIAGALTLLASIITVLVCEAYTSFFLTIIKSLS